MGCSFPTSMAARPCLQSDWRMTRSLIQECLLEGGTIASRRPERSRRASAEGFVACGAEPQEPSRFRQPYDRQWHPVAHPDRRALARSAREVGEVDDGLSALPTMERGRRSLGSGRNDARQAMADNSRHSLDSTTVRGHVSAAGVRGGLANQLFGRSRGRFTCEVHCLSDARGLLLVFPLSLAKPQTARRSKM